MPYPLRLAFIGCSVPATASRIRDDRLAFGEHKLSAHLGHRHQLAVSGAFKLTGGGTGESAAGTLGGVDGAVTHVPNLHIASERAKLDPGAGRAPEGAGPFAIGNQPALVHQHRVMNLIDLDAVDQRHPRVAHGQHGKPSVTMRGARPPSTTQDHLVAKTACCHDEGRYRRLPRRRPEWRPLRRPSPNLRQSPPARAAPHR